MSEYSKLKNFKEFWQINKLNSTEDSANQMPILTSLFPEQNTAHNVNEFTLKIILREMKKDNIGNATAINLSILKVKYIKEITFADIIECASILNANDTGIKLIPDKVM
uniref:PAP_central domain-containing protein n=1 Tax=Meloidogyne hapla TaxID=6305 RepID=A0A1I8B4M6_MELHA